MVDPLYLNSKNITNLTTSDDDYGFLNRLEALDRPMQAFLVCLYSLTSCLALIGNIIVIIVQLFGKRSAPNLRKFLMNLAVSYIVYGVLCSIHKHSFHVEKMNISKLAVSSR